MFIRQELLEIHKVQDFAQLYSVFHLQGGYSATEQTRTLFEQAYNIKRATKGLTNFCQCKTVNYPSDYNSFRHADTIHLHCQNLVSPLLCCIPICPYELTTLYDSLPYIQMLIGCVQCEKIKMGQKSVCGTCSESY